MKLAASLAAALGAATPMMAAAAEPQAPPPAVQQKAVSSADLQAKLAEAGGLALANAATCPGLLVLAEPFRWLDSGADLERIVLPAIRSRCATAKPGSIRSWGYFTQAVADAKATAEMPMPEGMASFGGKNKPYIHPISGNRVNPAGPDGFRIAT